MAYRIENARPEHIPGVCEAHRKAVLSVGPGPYTAKELDAWAAGMRPEKMERVLAEEGITLLVAADDAGVAGFILFAPTEVKALYVHPGHGHRGLGGRLLALAEQACRQHGASALRLTASRNAVPFYAGHGFQAVGRDVFPLRGGLLLECVTMEKALASVGS